MMLRPFDFHRTGFYMVWSTITQWRVAKIFLFALFILWVKDGTLDPVRWKSFAIFTVGFLAVASLLDVILMFLPAKAWRWLKQTREDEEAWERLRAPEVKP